MTNQFETTLQNARAHLLDMRNESGFWEGHLSSSALSTATAIVALQCCNPEVHSEMIAKGSRWLIEKQNSDGGWGDTTISHSNLSTTLLCWSALKFVEKQNSESQDRAKQWVEQKVGSIETEAIIEAVEARYGKDRTFAVPIVMLCVICGLFGDKTEAWKNVLPLPFELSVFPRSWYAALKFPVVSYALPALISIGYARLYNSAPICPLTPVKRLAWPRASRLLKEIQPASGGFLEATPLTSFVTMALASSGQKGHPVIEQAVSFIQSSMRNDGSWPIDTNLSTWCTTLASKALARKSDTTDFDTNAQKRISDWLLNQQYKEIHDYTKSPPGGWAWTNLSGGVPDADDTPGALIALKELKQSYSPAIASAITWLLKIQNNDGGIPTFCKGWGKLPFDRSSPDLTAHTIRAFVIWQDQLPQKQRKQTNHAIAKALSYLESNQSSEGYWTPLWFGNQHAPDETNPVYGTAMVLLALEHLPNNQQATDLKQRGQNWLTYQQNNDGGWSGRKGLPSSIEETSLALDALASSFEENALKSALDYLTEKTKSGTNFPPSPIGFYFAKLWYYEKIYPIAWTVSALEKIRQRTKR